MLTVTLAAAVLACSHGAAWNNDPWPAASQQRPATLQTNGDPWPAASQAQPSAQAYSGNPDEFWWNKQGGNSFDNAAARPQSVGAASHASSSYQAPSRPVRRQQAAAPSYQAGGGRGAPDRAIVSVSRASSGTPHVTGVRRVSSAASGVSRGSASSTSVSSQYIPPGAGSRPRPQQVLPAPAPPRHQSSGGSVSSGSFAPQGSGSFAPQGSGSPSYAAPSSHVSNIQSVASRPQPSRFNSGQQFVAPRPSTGSQYSGSNNQFSGSNSGQFQNQYAGSTSGINPGGSSGAQSPVVKSCSASLSCVDPSACDPYTGFLMDPSQGPIPQLDQPTVAFTRCYMNKSRSVGVCCQEPHINDPWTDRTTNGR